MPQNTVDFDPRQYALESLGRTADKLAGNTLQVGVSAARAIQNSLFPSEFEYYALTLELVDSTGVTLEYLTFPVMPEQLTYDDMKVANVMKTIGGITAIDNQSYTPKVINIQGTFGKRFKLLIKPDIKQTEEQLPSPKFTVQGESYGGSRVIKKPIFDERLKSGYGATKLLDSILTASSKLDDYGEPVRLYLYLPPLGDNFLVKCTQFQLSQNRTANNGYWNYNCQLTVIAPLDAIVDAATLKKSLQRNLVIDNLQKLGTETMNTAASSLRQLLSTRPGNQ